MKLEPSKRGGEDPLQGRQKSCTKQQELHFTVMHNAPQFSALHCKENFSLDTKVAPGLHFILEFWNEERNTPLHC